MQSEVGFYNILMYLYNKNFLEYAQIAQSKPKSMILNIEGHSNYYMVNKVLVQIPLLNSLGTY